MKVNKTSVKPNVNITGFGKSKYIHLVDEFMKGNEKYLVFTLEPEDKFESVRNSLHVGIERRGYKGITVHASKKDNVIYLEKKSDE